MNQARRYKKKRQNLNHYKKINDEIKTKLTTQIEENEKINADFIKLKELCFSQHRKLKMAAKKANSDSDIKLELHEINPALLSQFKSDSFLGKGTFGTVEIRKFHGYCVAVKKFKTDHSSKQDVLREATIMSRLSHQHLPYLFGICSTSTPYCLVSRFCGIEGEAVTVLDALRKESSAKLPWFSLMRESASALEYMHRSGYLHNDVKSDNLLLTQDLSSTQGQSVNQNVHVVLNDFGKSRCIAQGKLYKLSPAEKEKYYKLHSHIAPEVIEGDAPQSVQSDIFSLGIVFYDVARVFKIDSLRQFAKRCTRSNPAMRYNLVELIEELQKQN